MRSKGRSLDLGDVGFWVTCQRGKEIKALDEVVAMCDEVSCLKIIPQTSAINRADAGFHLVWREAVWHQAHDGG